MPAASVSARALRAARRSPAIENENASRNPTIAKMGAEIVDTCSAVIGFRPPRRWPISRAPRTSSTISGAINARGAVYSQLNPNIMLTIAPPAPLA
jgi:hypothetical protein